MKSRDLQPRLLYPTKLSFRIKGHTKSFPDKKKTKGLHHHQTIIIWNVKGTYLRKKIKTMIKKWQKIHIYQQLNLKNKLSKEEQRESWVQRVLWWLSDGTAVFSKWVKRSVGQKGHRFNSWSGHMTGLQVWSLVGAPKKSNWPMSLSYISVSLPLFSPPFPLSKNKYIKSFWKKECGYDLLLATQTWS